VVCFLFLLYLAYPVVVSAQSNQPKLPGEEDAIEQSVEQAVYEAVIQMTNTWPHGDVKTVAVLPLFNDNDRYATDALQHALIQEGTALGFRVLNRDDDRWNDLMKEFQFSEDNFDIMSKKGIREFGKVLGADAIVWGKVNHEEMDDSGLKGHGSVQLFLGVVETGQIAASGRGDQKVLLSAETGALWLLQQGWFLGLVVVGVVAAVVILIIYIPLRRKMALAAKPREIIR